MGARYITRDLTRVAVTGRSEVLFCGGDAPLIHRTDRPAAWSALLQRLIVPRTFEELLGDAAAPPEADAATLEALITAGHLMAAEDRALLIERRATTLSEAPSFHFRPETRQCRNLLIGCTGSIVAGLMAQTLLSLRFTGFQEQLDVILTDASKRFLTRDLLESYGVRCWQDGFEQQGGLRVPHVTLATLAELICVIPATADSLDRIARSACSDLLSLTIAASEAPVLIAPVMNETMWNNPGVQRNVATLRADGRFILEPTEIFGAAHFGPGAPPMYGGRGCLWSGPRGLIKALSAILELSRGALAGPSSAAE